jgi:hypothetical protein
MVGKRSGGAAGVGRDVESASDGIPAFDDQLSTINFRSASHSRKPPIR